MWNLLGIEFFSVKKFKDLKIIICKCKFEKINGKLDENNEMHPFEMRKFCCFWRAEHKYLVAKCENCPLNLCDYDRLLLYT